MTDLSPSKWVLRGGYSRLVLWAVDASGDATGESLSTGVVGRVGFAEDGETRALDDGALQELTRTRAVAPPLSRWSDVLELRRWAHAGRRVRAVLVARGRGHHLLWDEAVPVLLRSFSDDGTLSGDRLLLSTERFAASVESAPDLLGTGHGLVTGAWEGSAERVLPAGASAGAPGLTVYGVGDDAVTIEALDADGTVLATSPGAPSIAALALPEGAHAVRVSSASRPSLLTRLSAPASPVVATGADGSILTGADGAPLHY